MRTVRGHRLKQTSKHATPITTNRKVDSTRESGCHDHIAAATVASAPTPASAYAIAPDLRAHGIAIVAPPISVRRTSITAAPISNTNSRGPFPTVTPSTSHPTSRPTIACAASWIVVSSAAATSSETIAATGPVIALEISSAIVRWVVRNNTEKNTVPSPNAIVLSARAAAR